MIGIGVYLIGEGWDWKNNNKRKTESSEICNFLELIHWLALNAARWKFVLKHITSIVDKSIGKGWVLFLEGLRCKQIGQPFESVHRHEQ